MDLEMSDEGTRAVLQPQTTGISFSLIEQSYKLMQQALRAVFPKDEEQAYDEMFDLYEDELEARQRRRQGLSEQAEQFKLLYIEGLRTHVPEGALGTWRRQMLYRLAALFELAAIVDPSAVESLASKLDVSYQQGVASAVLKAQAEDVFMSREQIINELVGIDVWWHDPKTQLSSHIVELLHTPTIFGPDFVQRCIDETPQ